MTLELWLSLVRLFVSIHLIVCHAHYMLSLTSHLLIKWMETNDYIKVVAFADATTTFFFFVHWMCMHIKWNCVAQFIVIWCTKSNPVECLSLRVDFRNNPHKENTWYPQASEKNAKSIQTTAAKRNNDWEKPRTISLLLSIERCHFLWLVFECIYIYHTMMTMMKNEATEFRSLNVVVLFYFFGFFASHNMIFKAGMCIQRSIIDLYWNFADSPPTWHVPLYTTTGGKSMEIVWNFVHALKCDMCWISPHKLREWSTTTRKATTATTKSVVDVTHTITAIIISI